MSDRSGSLPLLAWTAGRLRALRDDEGTPLLGAVNVGLLDPQAIARQSGAIAVVLPLRDVAGESLAPTAGAVQRLVSTIGIALGVRAWNDPDGKGAIDPLTGLLDATRTALMGATPPATPTRRHGPLRLVRGELARFDPPIVWWQDHYEAEAWIGDSTETIGA